MIPLAVRELLLLAPGIPVGNVRAGALQKLIAGIYNFPLGTYECRYLQGSSAGTTDNIHTQKKLLSKFSHLKERIRRCVLYTSDLRMYVEIQPREVILQEFV